VIKAESASCVVEHEVTLADPEVALESFWDGVTVATTADVRRVCSGLAVITNDKIPVTSDNRTANTGTRIVNSPPHRVKRRARQEYSQGTS
jgi:hypothetical protein